MIYVLLPAYNEGESLPALMPKIKCIMERLGKRYEIVVCNDGSKDNTLELLEHFSEIMPIKIINHKVNRGLGETSRDLFEYVSEICDDDDVIIRSDCDDTHEPEFIPRMITKLYAGNYDIVVASRFASGGGQLGVNRYRAFISYSANLFMKIFFPISGLRDYSCGFRAYRGAVIRAAIQFYGNQFIQLKGLGFTCTLEKIIKLKLLGARITEEAFVLRYDQKLSSSKMVSSITALGYIIMTILYHWPWGGWRVSMKRQIAETGGELHD